MKSKPAKPAKPRYSRVHRLLRILTLVQGRPGLTAAALARECGTTPRTIFRDLNELSAAGVGVTHDPATRGYTVARDFFLAPVQLSLDEALAVLALAEQVAGRGQIAFTGPAARAADKLRPLLPPAVRDAVTQLEKGVEIRLAAAAPDDDNGVHDVYHRVRHAIATGRALRCEYDSVHSTEGGGGGEFLFHPYTLFFAQRAWYAIGAHTSRRGQVRTLKLSRFTRCIATDTPFTPPANFTLANHLGHAWRMIRGDTRYTVELCFAPGFADTISDTHWHATQQLDPEPDGSLTFRCTVDGLDEIVWWVLSMGPHCRVIQPPELAARVRKLAQQVAELY